MICFERESATVILVGERSELQITFSFQVLVTHLFLQAWTWSWKLRSSVHWLTSWLHFSNKKMAPEYFKCISLNLKAGTLVVCILCIQNLQKLSYVNQDMEKTLKVSWYKWYILKSQKTMLKKGKTSTFLVINQIIRCCFHLGHR